MPKHKKPKYRVNPATGETHKISAIAGACHVPDNAREFVTLAEVRAANFSDRCGHCFGLPKPKPASVQEGVI